jgi:hypothetical protein
LSVVIVAANTTKPPIIAVVLSDQAMKKELIPVARDVPERPAASTNQLAPPIAIKKAPIPSPRAVIFLTKPPADIFALVM